MKTHIIPLLALLVGCAAPTYELDEDPSGPETFQCMGYAQDLGVQYYYEAVIFSDGAVFVSSAVSDGVSSSSGTHFYAPGEDMGPVTVFKGEWIGLSLVLLPELGVRLETEDRNWVQLGGCTH